MVRKKINLLRTCSGEKSLSPASRKTLCFVSVNHADPLAPSTSFTLCLYVLYVFVFGQNKGHVKCITLYSISCHLHWRVLTTAETASLVRKFGRVTIPSLRKLLSISVTSKLQNQADKDTKADKLTEIQRQTDRQKKYDFWGRSPWIGWPADRDTKTNRQTDRDAKIKQADKETKAETEI